MQIVDAHHHLWDKSRFTYSWLAGEAEIDRSFLVSDYEECIRGTGVVKSVFVQAAVDGQFALQEARWALSLAEGDTPIQGVVAWAPVESPELESYLEALGAHPQLKGFRRLIQGEGLAFCTAPPFVAGVRALAAKGYTFDLCIYHAQLPAAIELVRQVPEMSFVLDHLAKPDIRSGIMEPWATQLRELASLPNVHCKISGMVTEADRRSWQPGQLKPYIDAAVEAFGLERLMFGSDWPVSLLGVEYGEWIAVVREAFAGVDQASLERLMCTNAEAFYCL